MTRGEKTHGRFPLVAPLFPLRLVPRNAYAAQYAAHAITAGRKKTKRRKNARNDKNTQSAATKDAKVYTESLNKLKARFGITAAHAPNLT